MLLVVGFAFSLIATAAFAVDLPQQGTPVAGVIGTNTTWTKSGSPYVLSGTVQVAYGATLTIQPGVVVEGGSKSLEAFGAISAIGTVSDKIRFNNTRIVYGANTSAQPCRIELRYCVLSGGELTPNWYGALTLADSRIEYPTEYVYVWYPTSDVHIERNIFKGSKGISAGTSDADVYIRNNVFYDQRSGSPYLEGYIEAWAGYNGRSVYVNGNTFYPPAAGGPTCVLELPAGYSSSSMDGTANYWVGVSDPSGYIYDKNDNLACAGMIPYAPVLSSPAAETPAFVLRTLSYSATVGGRIAGKSVQKVEQGFSGTEVTAIPDSGYYFAQWSDGLTTATRTDTSVTADKWVTAVFLPKTVMAASIVVPSTSAYRSVNAYGYLKTSAGTALAANTAVKIYSKTTGDWAYLTTAYTDVTGRYTKTLMPSVKTYYKAVYAGDAKHATVTSATDNVLPRARLTRSSSWDTKYDGKTYYYKGYIEPKHSTSDANKVKFKMYKKGSDGVYRWKKTVTASYSYYSSSKTRWTAKVVFPSAGRWRVRAYHAADAKNASSYSSYDYVTVK